MTGRQTALRLAGFLLAGISLEALAADPWRCAQHDGRIWDCAAHGVATPASATLPQVQDEWQTAAPVVVAQQAGEAPAPAPAAGAVSATPAASREVSERWSLCPPAAPDSFLETEAVDLDVINLEADMAAASPDRVFTLSGDATIRYGMHRLQASDITFRQKTGEVEASGGIRFAGPEIVVSGDSALLQTGQERGELKQLTYALPRQHARGGAELLSLEGAYRQHLEKAFYTTCSPGNRDWLLSAREVELDQAEGTGVARDAKVTFKGVPILYTPYISFPLDDRRKTGLLLPKVGTTEKTGVDISLPWYWNIAPNRDATITPRLMSDRGIMLGGEFRYLTHSSRGSINAEYLPSDDEFGGEDRSLVTLRHHGYLTERLEASILASDVSDETYFEDLGTDLVQTSQTSLERTARTTYHGQSWRLGLVVQDFQNLDVTLAPEDRPYRQLPQVVFDYFPDQRLLGIKAELLAEFNHFSHSDNSVVKGSRLDLQPRFSLPVQHAGWYVEPAVGVRHTAYTLDNTAPGQDTDPARTTPVASLDAGIFFERSGSFRSRPYIQTLEPRLFYLYVTEEDQQDLPVFDTGNYDFNFWTLFRENRFNGPDRMGDANQLALALTTRILNPDNGQQLLSASLGSLLYFRDRTVTLPGENVDLDNSSDLIGELDLSLTRFWSVRAEVLWNPHDSHTERSNYRLQYRRGPRQLVNLGYRFRDGIQEQADVSFLWPLYRHWHAVGRWYVDLDSNETIEALAGLGYEHCCWGLQLLGRSYINSEGSDRTTAIFLQLELKGLGKLGTSVDGALERGILGYHSNY